MAVDWILHGFRFIRCSIIAFELSYFISLGPAVLPDRMIVEYRFRDLVASDGYRTVRREFNYFVNDVWTARDMETFNPGSGCQLYRSPWVASIAFRRWVWKPVVASAGALEVVHSQIVDTSASDETVAEFLARLEREGQEGNHGDQSSSSNQP